MAAALRFCGALFSRFFTAPLAYTVSRGEDMVVYWDLVALWNFALDYILLLGALRLAGRSVRRGRVALAAALGAAYAVAALALPWLIWALIPAALLMCGVAFGRGARLLKLTLLFLLLACGLGGGVLLLGRVSGGTARLGRAMVYAELPWGVFFAAAGLSYLLLTLIFRGGARHDAGDFVTARIERGGRSVTLRLLRDTGNALTDPLTGEGVPVIEKTALLPLFSKGNSDLAAYTTFTPLRVGTVSGGGTLRAFRCDKLSVDGRGLGARLIAVSPEPLGGAYQGLWFSGEMEEERHDLAAMVG